MATLTTAWNIATSTLQSDQAALNVVSNNVSNADNKTYTRQVPTWQQNSTYEANGIVFGTGASVTGIAAQRDSVLEKRLNQQASNASATSSRLSALQNVQSIFTVATSTSTSTSSTGDLSTFISNFFNTFTKLGSNTNDTSLRGDVISSAKSLAQEFQSLATSLQQTKASVNAQASSLVDQVNALSASIAKLNVQIANSGGSDTNALQDERQSDLNQLSQLVGIQEIQGNHGTITVTTTAGDVLVNEGSSATLSTSTATPSGMDDYYLNGNPTPITTNLMNGGGKMGGLLTARDVDIPAYKNKLDTLALGIATITNTANNKGYADDGRAGSGSGGTPPVNLNIFDVTTTTDYASHMSLATISGVEVSGKDLALSSTNPSSTTGGDTLNLKNQLAVLSTDSIGGTNPTATNYYSAFVSSLGSLVKEVNINDTAQQASLSQLQNERDSLSAVSLNEEAANLSNYEKAYQSASRLFSILNTVMSSAINLGNNTSV